MGRRPPALGKKARAVMEGQGHRRPGLCGAAGRAVERAQLSAHFSGERGISRQTQTQTHTHTRAGRQTDRQHYGQTDR